MTDAGQRGLAAFGVDVPDSGQQTLDDSVDEVDPEASHFDAEMTIYQTAPNHGH